MDTVFKCIEERRDVFVDYLLQLLRIPSVSGDLPEVRRCAEALAGLMTNLRIDTRIIEVGKNPVIFGQVEGGSEATPTILFYGHYDVQPPGPGSEWRTPPFDPSIREGRVFARGAGDNKGQLLTHLAAVDAVRRVAGRLPVTVKFLFDGQEEEGSPDLPEFVRCYGPLLGADFAYISDSPVEEGNRPMMRFGSRGIAKIGAHVEEANRDVHSGLKGGVVPNAANVLVQYLASIVDDQGIVRIPGFYDGMRPITAEDKAQLARIPFDPKLEMKDLGLRRFENPSFMSYHEKIMFWPTFNVTGLDAGQIEPYRAAIPHKAEARFEFRLVVDQDPQDIFEKLAAYTHDRWPEVQVELLGTYLASRSSLDAPYRQVLEAAVNRAWGQLPVVYPVGGGSAPDYLFTQHLGMPYVWVPYGNSDENNHAPNENLEIACFVKGAKTTAAAIMGLASVPKRGGTGGGAGK